MTRLQSNKSMTELSLCTDTGRKWNKKATIPYRMKEINCLCLLHILEENMLLPNLPLLETGWNSCFVEDYFYTGIWSILNQRTFLSSEFEVSL